MRKLLLRVAGVVAGMVLLLTAAAWGYVRSLDLEHEPAADPATVAADLDFVARAKPPRRGRILAVVTGTERFPDGRGRAGYELTELARAYWVFVANGYEVDIASPLGGEPPMVKDEDLVEADYAFLNDPAARRKLASTLPLPRVEAGHYAAVYFVGGKGAMFDFPNHPDIARIVRAMLARGGAIGAVCHGPAALLHIAADGGAPLLRGRRLTGFSNAEELFLIENARERFPFLLQDALVADGAQFVEAPMYLDNTVVDGRLITGQNPWSTWSVAEAMIRALGHEPVPRAATAEEHSVRLLAVYRGRGLHAAMAQKAALPRSDKRLLLMHALIAAMRWRLGEAYELQRLARA